MHSTEIMGVFQTIGAWTNGNRKLLGELLANPSSPITAQLSALFLRQECQGENEITALAQGWAAYSCANYLKAAQSFNSALGSEFDVFAYIGLAKVATDLGSSVRALDYLAKSLTLARQKDFSPLLPEIYGSLAELAHRAGLYSLALEWILLDLALLAPGSAERARVENYQALIMGRLGLVASAERTYRENIISTRESNPYSCSFSVASLLHLGELGPTYTNKDQILSLWQNIPIAQRAELPSLIVMIYTTPQDLWPDRLDGFTEHYPLECHVLANFIGDYREPQSLLDRLEQLSVEPKIDQNWLNLDQENFQLLRSSLISMDQQMHQWLHGQNLPTELKEITRHWFI